MGARYYNFHNGTITDNPLTAGATTINSGQFPALPVVSAPDFVWLVLDPLGVAGAPEVAKVTVHTSSSGSVTVTRGQQGSTARQHAAGTAWRLAWTGDDGDQMPHRLATAKGDLIVATAAGAVDNLAVGSNGRVLEADSAQSMGAKWSAGWQNYTPSLTNWGLGNGTLIGRYSDLADTVHLFVKFTVGSTTTKTGTPVISLPVNAHSDFVDAHLVAAYYDVGVQNSTGVARIANATQIELNAHATESGTNPVNMGFGPVTSTVPTTWGTGDYAIITGFYRKA